MTDKQKLSDQNSSSKKKELKQSLEAALRANLQRRKTITNKKKS